MLFASVSCAADWIELSIDRSEFVYQQTGLPFRPWGFNYDHDETGRLIEDYWDTEWEKIVGDLQEMKALGANTVRIHLQVAKFMKGPNELHMDSLRRLHDFVREADKLDLYVNVTGLGCYHRQDVPEWYDRLDEEERWAAQATFWVGIAEELRSEPAVFCFNLMNEPVVPGGKRTDRDWLGPPFADKHFVQFITLDQAGRQRTAIARAWIDRLVQAICSVDERHLITVGLVDWSLDRPGLTSGFVPNQACGSLDFISVHCYPEAEKMEDASATVRGFQMGKPIVVEETFPLKCRSQQLVDFIEEHRDFVSGWLSFYWGKPIDELQKSNDIGERILWDWLKRFPHIKHLSDNN